MRTLKAPSRRPSAARRGCTSTRRTQLCPSCRGTPVCVQCQDVEVLVEASAEPPLADCTHVCGARVGSAAVGSVTGTRTARKLMTTHLSEHRKCQQLPQTVSNCARRGLAGASGICQVGRRGVKSAGGTRTHVVLHGACSGPPRAAWFGDRKRPKR